jgi:hypothetical protein
MLKRLPGSGSSKRCTMRCSSVVTSCARGSYLPDTTLCRTLATVLAVNGGRSIASSYSKHPSFQQSLLHVCACSCHPAIVYARKCVAHMPLQFLRSNNVLYSRSTPVKSTNAASRCFRQWDAQGQCSGLQLRGKWTSHIRALSSTPSKCIPCCSISTVCSTLCIASIAAGNHTFWAHIAWVQRRRV